MVSRTRRDDQQFLYGMMAGILVVVLSFVAVCEAADLKWSPVVHGVDIGCK